MGTSREELAATAGISVDELHDYEHTQPDRHFRLDVAEKVGAALERFEATRIPRVANGPVPHDNAD